MSLNIIHTPLVTWATSLQLIHTLGRKMVLHPALTTYLLNKEVLNSIHLCKLNKIPMTCHVWDRGLTMRSSINAIFQKVFFLLMQCAAVWSLPFLCDQNCCGGKTALVNWRAVAMCEKEGRSVGALPRKYFQDHIHVANYKAYRNWFTSLINKA